jgi:hypothetical protein
MTLLLSPLSISHIFLPFTTWVLRRLADTRLVVLLADETSLQERLKVMAVSLAYRGRAIPLAW